MSGRIPITLLSGYLGSGKTTIVNHILQAENGRKLAVLVNDFGAVNIDAGLVRQRGINSVDLNNGCVCCSIGDDLGAALSAQDEAVPPPDAILLEASGVSEPARIARLVGNWPGFELDAVVVAADAETVRRRAEDKFVAALVQSQLRSADIVALTKTDLVSASAADDLKKWLQNIAPQAHVVAALHGALAPEIVFAPTLRRHATSGAVETPGHTHFATFAWEPDQPVDLNSLRDRLSELPTSIHRVKGMVIDAATGSPVLVQKVGQRCEITVNSALTHPCLVMISPVAQTDFVIIRAQLETCQAVGP